MSWLSKNGKTTQDSLTLGDLMDLGFDPTRLKEIRIDETSLIFERTPIRALPKMENRRDFLNGLSQKSPHFFVKNTKVHFNPPLLLIRDRGNGYILRKKVPGIHWEEAVEQLNTSPALKELNDHLGLERIVTRTVAKVNEKMKSCIEGNDLSLVDPSGIFVSWDLEVNQPRMVVDMTTSYLETIWIS